MPLDGMSTVLHDRQRVERPVDDEVAGGALLNVVDDRKLSGRACRL